MMAEEVGFEPTPSVNPQIPSPRHYKENDGQNEAKLEQRQGVTDFAKPKTNEPQARKWTDPTQLPPHSSRIKDHNPNTTGLIISYDIQEVIDAWTHLSEPIRAGIIAIIRAVVKRRKKSDE